VATIMLAPPCSRKIVASVPGSCNRLAAGLLVAVLAAGCGPEEVPPRSTTPPPDEASQARDEEAARRSPHYVGSSQCSECHAEVAARWLGSDHDLAMQEATPATVLGRFDQRDSSPGAPDSQDSSDAFDPTPQQLDGQEWRFERRGDAFIVRAPAEDGPERDHEIAYVFGVRPLQQYLVRAAGGRLQPLPVAWDARPGDDGGQRWLHLYEGAQLRADDPLHWTGRIQTWNHQCATCHSTALERGYDEASDRYDTRWQELDVACEACHGPGSRHVELARPGAPGGRREIEASSPGAGLTVDLSRSPGTWELSPDRPIARRTQPALHARREIDSCAPCHSRRSRIAPDAVRGNPFLDGYLPSLIDEGLYFADGRMRDEVYVWGSFQQSRMHAAGVTCSDCHDPHSLEVRDGPDAVCATCHLPEVFATTGHHGHAPDSAGASCVACHMPERRYMQVDDRRDHSLRVPRPDIAAATGSPGVCIGCHEDRDAAWAADSLASRGALRDGAHPGSALAAAWAGEANAGALLAVVVADPELPAILRASAASQLAANLSRATLPALRSAFSDDEPLVRLGAARALDSLAPVDRLALGRELLRDPVRAVRIEAARSLAAVPAQAWPPGTRVALADALAEYRASQLLHADRPEAQLSLASLELNLGDLPAARRRGERAVELAPHAIAPRVNLADVLRRMGDEAGAEAQLREGLAAHPDTADLHFALGLSYIRQDRRAEATDAFARAHELAPDSSRLAYTYALALHDGARSDEAVSVLAQAHDSQPADRDLLVALATIERDRGHSEQALRWADALVALDPRDEAAQQLRNALAPRP